MRQSKDLPAISGRVFSFSAGYDFVPSSFWNIVSRMELPKVIIKDSYADYLEGKEVEATLVSEKKRVEKGMHVMGFHNSIAVNTGVPVPKDKQSHYLGVEGRVTDIREPASGDYRDLRVVKV